MAPRCLRLAFQTFYTFNIDRTFMQRERERESGKKWNILELKILLLLKSGKGKRMVLLKWSGSSPFQSGFECDADKVCVRESVCVKERVCVSFSLSGLVCVCGWDKVSVLQLFASAAVSVILSTCRDLSLCSDTGTANCQTRWPNDG